MVSIFLSFEVCYKSKIYIAEPSRFPATAYGSLKNKAIAIEAQRTAMKGEIEAIADAIARVDKKATAALREKRESWQAIAVC